MNVYETPSFQQVVENNEYVGRGVLLGKPPDGTKAVTAYFIMGRSENSRNRVFRAEGDDIVIYPFDESKVEDPSLIIYHPLRVYENKLVVTNGDQTDTIWEGLKEGKCFRQSLKSREFEPDAPNWTPRISGMITFENGDMTYQMSILKSGDAEGTFCNRFTYDYGSKAGLGHLIHTYMGDGNPLPTFQGEPHRLATTDDIDAFTQEIWTSLNPDHLISLYVRYTDLETGKYECRLINKHEL